MSWRDVLAAAPRSPQYSHNPHNSQSTGGCENIGNIGEKATAYAASASTRAAELRREAAEARDWEGLYAVLDAAQVAYDAGEVTQEEVESLAGYVGERSRHVPEDAASGTLGELLRSQPVVRVHSRLLGETVVWIAEGVEAPEDIDEVAYSEHELRQLVGQAPELVRAIHEVKRALDGELVTGLPRAATGPAAG